MYEGPSIWTHPDGRCVLLLNPVMFCLGFFFKDPNNAVSCCKQKLRVFFLYLFRTKLAPHFHVWLTAAATEHIPDITFLQNDCICRHGNDRAPEGKDDIKI